MPFWENQRHSPTGTIVAYSSEMVPNSSVDFNTGSNFGTPVSEKG